MSEMFTIKPLEWRWFDDDGQIASVAETIHDMYVVSDIEGLGWSWSCRMPSGEVTWLSKVGHGDIDAARLAAEAHWQERIKQALVAVEKVGYHDVDAYYEDEPSEKRVQQQTKENA